MSVLHLPYEKTCGHDWSDIWKMVGSVVLSSRRRRSRSLSVSMRMWQDERCGFLYSQKWDFGILRLSEGRKNGETKDEARGGSLKDSYDLVFDARKVQQPNQQRVQILRSQRYQSMLSMGRLFCLFGRYGTDMGRRLVNRPFGCERKLRTHQLHMDTTRRSIAKSPFWVWMEVQGGSYFNLDIRGSWCLVGQTLGKMGWCYCRQQSFQIPRCFLNEGRRRLSLPSGCAGTEV